jgi:hypothetical protein
MRLIRNTANTDRGTGLPQRLIPKRSGVLVYNAYTKDVQTRTIGWSAEGRRRKDGETDV